MIRKSILLLSALVVFGIGQITAQPSRGPFVPVCQATAYFTSDRLVDLPLSENIEDRRGEHQYSRIDIAFWDIGDYR